MPMFRVYGVWTASKLIGEFEADTENDAIEMAEIDDNNYAVLCHQCSDSVELNDYSAERFEAELAD